MKKRKKQKASRNQRRQNMEKQREAAMEFAKSEKGRPFFIWMFQIAVVLALAAVTAIFFFQGIAMQEGSMEPSFQAGERFFINRVVYKMSDPKRGDVVAFTKDGKDNAAIHIKRVIGLPGETIQIKEGRVYIDGELYEEEFPEIINPGLADEPVTLKKDEYFLLGDNRNNSEDSRFAEVKNIKKRYIKGKVWFRIAPLDHIGFITN